MALKRGPVFVTSAESWVHDQLVQVDLKQGPVFVTSAGSWVHDQLVQVTLHSKKFIVKFTKYLGNFGTKTLGESSKPVCIFRKIGHTINTSWITFTAK